MSFTASSSLCAGSILMVFSSSPLSNDVSTTSKKGIPARAARSTSAGVTGS